MKKLPNQNTVKLEYVMVDEDNDSIMGKNDNSKPIGA